MKFGTRVTEWSADHYKLVTGVMVGVTLAVAALAAVPSVLYYFFDVRVPVLKPIRVDTDPENMLDAHEPVRVFHDAMKKELNLYDMIVVGVVNDKNPNGVFNPDSLRRIHELTEFARTLQWEIDGQTEGVVDIDLIAPSTVDNIEQAGPGTVEFSYLMREPPKTEAEALKIRDEAQRISFLNGTLVSEDGKAIALYLPITRKDLSHQVYVALNKKIAELGGDDTYHITGLPVAEDVFGVEMFVQMAISAPMAMGVIFLLMLLFFRKLILIISPMIIAMVAVILTMGALIIAGFPVHIMSSMIPIFIMPIAVLDAVHILSEFFDRYQKTRDRKQTIVRVMDELFMPMLYTSLTSAAGFASLALTPIPPVQVFGIFVALGIMAAWALTIAFMPAYVMFIKPETLANFGAVHADDAAAAHGPLGRFLAGVGRLTYRQAKPILALTVVVMAISGYGISRIRINDNPVKWFEPAHPIRVADRVLNEHFGGTYMAFLALQAPEETFNPQQYLADFRTRAAAQAEELQAELPDAPQVFKELTQLATETIPAAKSRLTALDALAEQTTARYNAAHGDASFAWDEASLFVDAERQRGEIFKQPAMLKAVADLQAELARTGDVGKSNSVVDIVKTVHRELLGGTEDQYRIPDSHQAVAQTLMTYQNSHQADDLWHFVTPDYRTASIWVQLTSGDNRDMSHVVHEMDKYLAAHPLPDGIQPEWFGLTYINVVWQEKMVWGMLQAFLGSFLVVFILMTILFRSALWGLLSMVPLTVTIAFIYGAVGLVGKAYDMPVAVLSSLSLGLAVDFAIHFLARSRRQLEEHGGDWEHAVPTVFGEPARAITRNIIVIAVGFTPLLFAPLVPYQTVGVLLATILLVSGFATLLILPALVRVLEKRLFAKTKAGMSCNCGACAALGVSSALLIAVSLQQYWNLSWTTLTIVAVVAIPVSSLICGLLARRSACRTSETTATGEPA